MAYECYMPNYLFQAKTTLFSNLFTTFIFPTILATAGILLLCCNKSEKTDNPSTNPPPPPTSRFNINAGLVTPNATTEATALYKFLKDNYGKSILSGVMTLNSFDETNWLKTNTGKEPAIIGLDFMHCNRAYSWYDNEQPIKDAKTYWDKNGIPVLIWHWRDPSRLTEEFYSNKTSFDISKVNDTASAEYKAMMKDIDFVASLLKKLQDQKVPVIWRPLHEAAGGWFWWGAKGAAPCKKLYQLMYDRLTNFHNLRNLIWVWTREPNDQAWYPGDEYVDIVGRDIYRQGDHSSLITEFNAMNTLYGSKKMVTISECGSIPDVDSLIKDKAAWSWYMTWYGDYTRSSTHNSLDLWKKMFASSYVITLDEMPSLK
jgi:mannan endo-1,4-beta-mannosidase